MLLLGPDPDLQFAKPRICLQIRGCAAHPHPAQPRIINTRIPGWAGHGAVVYQTVVAQIEDPDRGQGQEGGPRRGGGPPGRPLQHFKAPDGATYVLYIYLVYPITKHSPTWFPLL